MSEYVQKWWAQRANRKLGPFASREQAEIEGQALFPKRPVYRDAFMTGYGAYGPHFDIRFVYDKREI